MEGELSEEEIEEILEEARAGLAEAEETLENLPEIIEQALASAELSQGRTFVEMSCDGTNGEASTTTETDDGVRVLRICQTNIMAEAIDGLREARDEIAATEDISAELRDRILRQLDDRIESWEAR